MRATITVDISCNNCSTTLPPTGPWHPFSFFLAKRVPIEMLRVITENRPLHFTHDIGLLSQGSINNKVYEYEGVYYGRKSHLYRTVGFLYI
jgi:hypothetical protein